MMYRLWHVREDAEGKMNTDEIPERPLKRTMLLTNDTYILELYNKVYVWQGHAASDNEKYACMKIAVEHKEKMNKPKGTSITRIPEGVEDSLFVSFFEDFYGAYNTAVNKEVQKKIEGNQSHEISFEGFKDPKTTKFPYEDLKDKFPEGVKPNKKEYYLSEEEFQKLFEMSFDEYLKIPEWKQPRYKKPLGLF